MFDRLKSLDPSPRSRRTATGAATRWVEDFSPGVLKAIATLELLTVGRPPTGKSVTYDEIFILRFTNGRIAEMWGAVDVLPQMQQLGMIPV